MDERSPRNQDDEAPTRTPEETAHRLGEKAEGMSGVANRERTGAQIDEVTSERGEH